MILYRVQCNQKVTKDNAPSIIISRTFTLDSVLSIDLLHFSVLIYFFFVQHVYEKQKSTTGFSYFYSFSLYFSCEALGYTVI
jgi:hypothetical protein